MKSFKAIAKICTNALVKNSPDILLALGAVTLAGSAVPAIIATPKASKAIELRKNELCVDELGFVETVKTVWKYYIPTGSCWIIGGGCIIASKKISNNRTLALMTAYKASEAFASEYASKVIEDFGEKQDRSIRERIAQDQIKNDPKIESYEVHDTQRGYVPCRFNDKGIIFESNFMEIKEAILRLNARMVESSRNGPYSGEKITFNELLDEFDIPHIRGGDDEGWDIDTTGIIDIYPTSTVDKNGKQVLGINFRNRPVPFYEL